jgi:hypothetical protein
MTVEVGVESLRLVRVDLVAELVEQTDDGIAGVLGQAFARRRGLADARLPPE